MEANKGVEWVDTTWHEQWAATKLQQVLFEETYAYSRLYDCGCFDHLQHIKQQQSASTCNTALAAERCNIHAQHRHAAVAQQRTPTTSTVATPQPLLLVVAQSIPSRSTCRSDIYASLRCPSIDRQRSQQQQQLNEPANDSWQQWNYQKKNKKKLPHSVISCPVRRVSVTRCSVVGLSVRAGLQVALTVRTRDKCTASNYASPLRSYVPYLHSSVPPHQPPRLWLKVGKSVKSSGNQTQPKTLSSAHRFHSAGQRNWSVQFFSAPFFLRMPFFFTFCSNVSLQLHVVRLAVW